MGRVDEEYMPSSRHGGVEAGLQVGFEKLGLGFDVFGQVFLGGTGTMRTRWNFSPRPLRNLRVWLGPRRRPVNSKTRSTGSPPPPRRRTRLLDEPRPRRA